MSAQSRDHVYALITFTVAAIFTQALKQGACVFGARSCVSAQSTTSRGAGLVVGGSGGLTQSAERTRHVVEGDDVPVFQTSEYTQNNFVYFQRCGYAVGVTLCVRAGLVMGLEDSLKAQSAHGMWWREMTCLCFRPVSAFERVLQ